MKAAVLCLSLALFGCVVAEPPSGYNYNRPSSGGHSSGGHSSGGYSSGGYSSGGSSGLSSGGSYQQVAPGPQTNEGANLDQGLLEQIKQVLLSAESQSSSSVGGGYPSAPSSSYGAPSGGYSAPSSGYSAPSGGYSAPSSSYGAPAPSSSYGAPSTGGVSGLDLEGIQQAIQVAQFTQQQQVSGGYPSAPSGSYGAPSSGASWSQSASAPSSSYGAPSRTPSGSYGAPF